MSADDYLPGEYVNLKSLTKEEWWDVSRAARPEITWDEFEEYWAGFVEIKRMKGLN